ncbi:MAG: GspH/FimT family pseudopilin [Deltaproteobacteria bacterium]|nr:GspH/FimT family pseudopilin [Deltaproteobacteria bacterium]
MRFADDKTARGGFTLVEILITLAILGILLTIAVGNFGGLNEKYKVEAETKQLYADLMDARGRATQRDRISFVQVNDNGYKTFEDTNPVPDGDGNLTVGDTQVADVTVNHQIITTGGLSDFRFNRNGIASVTGFIRFSSTAQPDYDCITITATRIKMGQYDATGNTCAEK